jgi:copper chaperone
MSTPESTHVFLVDGMSCQHCLKAVIQALQHRDADALVDVDLPSGRVTVRTRLSREAASSAMAVEGYVVRT